MEKLTEKQVRHVANLAKLNVLEDEVSLYQEHLSGVLDEIEMITKLEINDDTKIMISPSENINEYSEFEQSNNISKEDALKNAPFKDEDYIKVVKVIND